MLAPCGPGAPLVTGALALWQMLALPCVPSANPASVVNIFGSGTLSNLDSPYNVANPPNSGWVIRHRNYTTLTYDTLQSSDVLTIPSGYWIKSFQAPTGGQLALVGAATTAPVTQAQGCAVATGCRSIFLVPSLTSGASLQNLVGNPFPYAIDWSKVRIRIDDSSTTFTPSQAANVATGADAAGNVNPPVISNVVNIWNGTAYVPFSDVAPTQGNLQYFKSFWVNVCPAPRAMLPSNC
jgi:hypothetical protein